MTMPYARPPATIRGALLVGFAVVFCLWVMSGYELVRRLKETEAKTIAEQQAVARGERVLSTIRTNVLLGSIYLRDALIDNRVMEHGEYQQALDTIRGNVERVLPAYLTEVTSPEERQHWAELQRQLDEYWKSRELVFSRDVALSTTEAATILRRRVVPARQTILQIVVRISDLQQLSQRRHESGTSQLYAELRERFLLIGSVAIVVGFGFAWLATRHVALLGQQIERQRQTERRTREELQWLSARLVNVQEEERRSLARELHDEVGQALTAIKMDVTVALRGIEGRREKSSLEDARSLAENTLQTVRDLSQLLHPSMLDDFGLPTAIRSHLRAFTKRTGISGALHVEGMDQRMAPDAEVCAYRIVQEALTNVARHSGARQVDVSLSRDDGSVTITVEDDGRGVRASNEGAVPTRGLGVIGMRERAQALGGTFSIAPLPAGGTRVSARIPVKRFDVVSLPPALLAG